MIGIRQVRPSNVERRALRAIARRIGRTSGAVVSIQRDEAKPGSVVLVRDITEILTSNARLYGKRAAANSAQRAVAAAAAADEAA